MTVQRFISSSQGLAVAAGALVVLGLSAVLPERLERAEAYARAGRHSSQIELEQLGDFLVCALIDARTSELDGSSARAGFSRMGRLFGARYGKLLSTCDVRMDAFVSGVQALAVPPKLRGHHTMLLSSANELRVATRRYQEYVLGLEGAYNAAIAAPMLDALGQAVSGYQQAQSDLHRALGHPRDR